MSIRLSSWLRGATLAGALLAAGCAGFNASTLQPGVSTLPQIEAALGKPAMVWKNPDGTSQLAYPFGPSGTQTFMGPARAGRCWRRCRAFARVDDVQVAHRQLADAVLRREHRLALSPL
jgi:hypothetical protein